MLSIIAVCASTPGRAKPIAPTPFQSGVSGIPKIEHFPATFGVAGKPLDIEAQVVAPGRAVVYVRIYYKIADQQHFKHLDMRPGPQGYLGQIPAREVRAPAMQYFLVALLSDQTVINYPTKNPYGQPFEVSIREIVEKPIESSPVPKSETGEKTGKKSSTSPASEPVEVSPQFLDKIRRLEQPTASALTDTSYDTPETSSAAAMGITGVDSPILVLSPEPFSSVTAGEAVIAASFMTETAIDSSSIQILVDGLSVTEQAEISAVMISYSPTQIKPGEHTVTISARDELGRAVGPMSWRFEVIGRSAGSEPEAIAAQKSKNRPTGLVYAEMRREKFSGVSLNNNNAGANLTGNTGPLAYSASAYFTSLEDEAFQPRNRFVLTAGLPWLSFTLGDATPYFDELVLWGRRVRGLQAGLHTGWINFDFVSGETVRQTPTTYKQNLIGLRPSFGSPNGFLWGFTLLKVRDDKNSLTAGASPVTPRDNLVLGTDLIFAFDRRRLELQASGAFSLLTSDISSGALSKATAEEKFDTELPFDPQDLEKWFILNESTAPLDPRGKTSLAYQLGLRFNYFNHFIYAGYKQIGSQYVSLGHSFLRNDIRGFFISDRWRMFRNRVYFTLGLESYDDHFNTIDDRPQTKLKTWQYGLSIYWDPNLPSLNFTVRDHNRNNGVDTSMVTNFAAENNVTRDYSVSLNYEVTALNFDHTLTFSLMSSDRTDHVNAALGEVSANLKALSLRTKFQMPLTSTITYATNANDIAGGQSLFKYKMFSGRADYDFLHNNLSPENRGLQMRAYGGFSSISASGGTATVILNSVISQTNVIDYNQTSFQLGGSLQFKKQHELVLDFNLVNYKDHGGVRTITTTTGESGPDDIITTTNFAQNRSYKNSIIRVYYAFRF
jgi:hypothetical protein